MDLEEGRSVDMQLAYLDSQGMPAETEGWCKAMSGGMGARRRPVC